MSPGLPAPISSTAYSASSGSASSDSGRPISLLRLPALTCVRPCSARIDASSVFTVVLPLEPVMPTTRARRCARTALARSPSAASVSATTTCGRSTSSGRVDQRRSRAALVRGRATKSCASKCLALERDEQRARRQRARVGATRRARHSAPCRRAAGPRATSESRSFMPCAPARGARPRVVERMLDAGDFLYGSWPLPAISTTSPGCAARSRARSRRARSRSTVARSGCCEAGEDLRDDRVAVFAARIVVGDDDAIGQRLGDRAHLRTLARVALAAAAEHADQRAGACARRLLAPARARRACARSRRRRAAARRRRRDGSCGPRPARAAPARRGSRRTYSRARRGTRRPRAGCTR